MIVLRIIAVFFATALATFGIISYRGETKIENKHEISDAVRGKADLVVKPNAGKLIRTIPIYAAPVVETTVRGSTPQRQSDADQPQLGPQVEGSSPSSSTSPPTPPDPSIRASSVGEAKPEGRYDRLEAYCNRPGKDRYSWIRIRGVKHFCKE